MTTAPAPHDLPGAGTLYIKGERDRLNGEYTPYYKVGIVRGEKEAKDRDGALSTGNPRDITNLLELHSPFVQKLETRLHNEFAYARVSSNEWFHTSLCPVDTVRDRARQLQAELVDSIDALVVAENQDGPGEAPAVPADEEALELAERLARIAGDQELIASVKKAAEKALKDLAESDERLWDVYFKASTRKESSTLSATEVKKRYPELYAAFVAPVEAKPKLSWNLPEVDTDQAERLKHWALPTPGSLAGDDADAAKLHQIFLDAWAAEAVIDWDRWIVEAFLRSKASGTQGIEGLISWSARTTNTFDKSSFSETHPELVDECTVSRPVATSFAVQEWVASVTATTGTTS